MRTVITTERNGVEIIDGFGYAVVDPAKTSKDADRVVKQSDAYKRAAAMCPPSGDFDAELMPKLVTEIQSEYDRLRRENPVYCHPKPGEYILTADEFAGLLEAFESLAPGQVLTRDGQVMNAVDLMSEEEKQQRRAQLVSQAEEESLRIRSLAEIRDDVDAIKKARDYLKKKLGEIDGIYG
jgi:hypothetical protein